MAQKPLTDADLRETAALWKKLGSRNQAAAQLGIARSTFQHRLLQAEIRGFTNLKLATDKEIEEYGNHARSKVEVADVITPPVFPSGDTPIGELIPRLVEDANRRLIAHHARSGYASIPVKMKGPIAVAFIGDPHVDDAGCHWGKLYEDVETIQRNKHIVSVCVGDVTNNWVGRLSRLYGEQGTTQKTAWELVKWLIPALRPIVMIKGNHNLWSGPNDPLDFMKETAEVWTQSWTAKIQLEFSTGAHWRGLFSHDFKGTSMWNPLHANQRKAVSTGARAHFYGAGHRHEWGLAQHEDPETGHVYWLGRARGYKVIDAHADQLGYESQRYGHTIIAVIDPSERDNPPRFCQMFSDLQEASEYLNWKRSRA